MRPVAINAVALAAAFVVASPATSGTVPKGWSATDAAGAAEAAESALPGGTDPVAVASARVELGDALATGGRESRAREEFVTALAGLRTADAPRALLGALARGLVAVDDARDALAVDDLSRDPVVRASVLAEVATAAIRKGDVSLARSAVTEIKALRMAPGTEGKRETALIVVASSFRSKGLYADVLAATSDDPGNFMSLHVLAETAADACGTRRDPAVEKGLVRSAEAALGRGRNAGVNFAYGEASAILSLCRDGASAKASVEAALPPSTASAALSFGTREVAVMRAERARSSLPPRRLLDADDPETTAMRALRAHADGDEALADAASGRTLDLLGRVVPGPGWSRGMRQALDATRADAATTLARAGHFAAANSAVRDVSPKARLATQVGIVDEAMAKGSREDVKAAVAAASATAKVLGEPAGTAYSATVARLAAKGFVGQARALAAEGGPAWSRFADGRSDEATPEAPTPARTRVAEAGGDLAVDAGGKAPERRTDDPERRRAAPGRNPGIGTVDSLLAADDLVGATRVAEATAPGDPRRDDSLLAVARAQASGRLTHAAFGTALRIADRAKRFRALLPVVATPPTP